MNGSLAGEVVVEVEVDCRDVLQMRRHFHFLVLLALVDDAVVGEGGFHVEYLALAFPGVAASVGVDFFVSVEYFPHGFLPGDGEGVLGVAEGVDDAQQLGLLGEFADEVLLVLPPGDGQRVALQLQVQVATLRNVELLLALRVDEAARFLGLLVEPGGDVGAGGGEDGFDVGQVAVLLDEAGEIVDVVEEGDPDIVGGAVRLQFRQGVVAPLPVGLVHQLLQLLSRTLFTHLKHNRPSHLSPHPPPATHPINHKPTIRAAIPAAVQRGGASIIDYCLMNPHYSSPRHVPHAPMAPPPFYNPQKEGGPPFGAGSGYPKSPSSSHFIPGPVMPSSKSYIVKPNYELPKVSSNNSGYLKSTADSNGFANNYSNFAPPFPKTNEMAKSLIHDSKTTDSAHSFASQPEKPTATTPPRRQPRYSEPAQFESPFEPTQDTKASFIPYSKPENTEEVHFYKKQATPELNKEEREGGREWLKQSGRGRVKKGMNLESFEVVRSLGKGKYGQVFLAREKKSGFMCALKVVEKAVIIEEGIVDQFIREVKIQLYLNHPNIVKLYACFDDDKNIYVVLEVAMGGQLYQQLRRSEPMPEAKVAGLMKQVCAAVEELHASRVIHRDIKPENIVMHEGIVKLCDFGWSVHLDNKMRTTFCGTPLYVCPQILKGNQYDQKIDIWSLGIMMYEMLVGENPFKINKEEELIKIVKDEISIPSYVYVSREARDFLDKCLQKNPNDRVNIKLLVNHDFFLKNADKPDKKMAL